MRTMNYITIISILYFGISCSEATISDQEDLASTEYQSRLEIQGRETRQEVFELDLHQYYVLGQIGKLKQRKTELEAEIERGNRKQIPVLESVLEEIRKNTEVLNSILESTCAFLEVRKRAVLLRVMHGDRGAKAELKEINEKLEKCDDDTEDYIDGDQMELYAYYKGPIRDICIPQDEWGCKDSFEAGTLYVNFTETQGRNPEIYFKSAEGRTISRGRNIGGHSEYQNVTQTAINLASIKLGILEFVHKDATYKKPVNVR